MGVDGGERGGGCEAVGEDDVVVTSGEGDERGGGVCWEGDDGE